MNAWRCTCGANNVTHFCEMCGNVQPKSTRGGEPAYREFKQRLWQVTKLDEQCTEPGCDKTARDHMLEARRFCERIDDEKIVRL